MKYRCLQCDWTIEVPDTNSGPEKCVRCGSSNCMYLPDDVQVVTIAGGTASKATTGDLRATPDAAGIAYCYECGSSEDTMGSELPRGFACTRCRSKVTRYIPREKTRAHHEAGKCVVAAESLFRNGDYSGTINKCREALTHVPDHPIALLDLACALCTLGWQTSDRGMAKDGIRQYEHVLELYPSFERARKNRDQAIAYETRANLPR